jgi:uncharacterized protein YjbJ (UPF0337 family)
MGITDKITGRAKKVVGDITGDSSTRREGQKEEKKGEVKDQAARAQDSADAKKQEAANLDRKT